MAEGSEISRLHETMVYGKHRHSSSKIAGLNSELAKVEDLGVAGHMGLRIHVVGHDDARVSCGHPNEEGDFMMVEDFVDSVSDAGMIKRVNLDLRLDNQAPKTVDRVIGVTRDIVAVLASGRDHRGKQVLVNSAHPVLLEGVKAIVPITQEFPVNEPGAFPILQAIFTKGRVREVLARLLDENPVVEGVSGICTTAMPYSLDESRRLMDFLRERFGEGMRFQPELCAPIMPIGGHVARHQLTNVFRLAKEGYPIDATTFQQISPQDIEETFQSQL